MGLACSCCGMLDRQSVLAGQAIFARVMWKFFCICVLDPRSHMCSFGELIFPAYLRTRIDQIQKVSVQESARTRKINAKRSLPV